MKTPKLFKQVPIQKAMTVVTVISSVEYLVADAVNRRSVVQSDKSFNVGDYVVVQGKWIIGRGKTPAVIQNFEV